MDLLLFAGARQRAGKGSVGLDLPEGATVGDLKAALARSEPALAPYVPGLRIAVDSEYADDARTIPPGAELAAIPPVSGGAPDGQQGPRPDRIEITDRPIDHAAVVEQVRSDRAGAICSFLGTVREVTGEKVTASLEYEAYPQMALRKLTELVEQARGRWPIVEAAVVHRVGRLELGDVAVVVAISTPHRREGFEACQWLMDTIKEVVPIWKKETYADGAEEWVHPGLDPAPPTA